MLDSDVSLATILGHAFEHFVKAGALRALGDQGLSPGDAVRKELGKVSLDAISRALGQLDIPDPNERQRIDRYLEHMAGWASIAGYGLLRDYLAHISGGLPGKPELLWLACPVGTHHFDLDRLDTESRGRIHADLPRALGLPTIPVGPSGRGRFENADWISLLEVNRKRFLLVLEFSLFATISPEFLADPGDPVATLQQYRGVLSTLRRKGAFSHLNLSLADDFFRVGPEFADYLQGIRRADKPMAKLLQGCAYATDFLDRTRDAGQEWRRGEVHVISVTDRGMQSFAATFADRDRLRPFAKAVWAQSSHEGEKWDEFQKRQREASFRSLIQSFPSETRKSVKDFYTAALHPTDDNPVTMAFSESPTGIANPANPIDIGVLEECLAEPAAERWIGAELAGRVLSEERDKPTDLRSLHARLVRRLLDRDYPETAVPVIALTGHPGIGKTTAIRDALIEGEDGFLFLYFSPRIQISRDVLNAFERDSPQPVVTLTTNSEMIADFIHRRDLERRTDRSLPPLSGAVTYGGRGVELPDDRDGFRFVRQEIEQELEAGPAPDQKFGYREQSRDTIVTQTVHQNGVLKCLAQGINQARKAGYSRIVGAVSTQALKGTGDNQNTLKSLQEIIPFLNGSPFSRELGVFAKKIPRIVVMLDEITGSSEGVELLHSLVGKLHEWFVAPFYETDDKSPFQIRVIVADASLTDENVTRQFLSEPHSELSKIVISQAGDPTPISVRTFRFRGKDAPLLNASSFPAAKLDLVYRLALIPPLPDGSRMVEASGANLHSILNRRLLESVVEALKDAPQIIVFVQDITRLDELEGVLRKEHGLPKSDILVINSRIRNSERSRILKEGKHLTARVVLMTSSASRGISFPKTSVILAEVPRFAPEESLMEIVQLVYRGRGRIENEDGGYTDGDRIDRRLEFFLTETLPVAKTEERINDLVAMAVLTRAAVMTRIRGFGEIGKRRVSVVPVGAKLVENIDPTDSERIIQFRTELEKEFNVASSDALCGVCAKARDLFDRIFGDHGSHKITNRGRTQSPTQIDSVNIRNEWVGNKLVPRLRLGLDGIFEIRDFPTKALYCSGALFEEREGEATDELTLQTAGIEAQIGQLVALLGALRDGHLRGDGGAQVKLSIRSRTLMTTASKVIGLLNSLRYSKVRGEAPSDRRRVDQRNRSGLWLAHPSMCFSRYTLMTEYMREASTEIHEEWHSVLLDIARLNFGAMTQVAPIIPRFDDIPFCVFRSSGVEMYRSQLFSPTALRATHELQLLNILLLD